MTSKSTKEQRINEVKELIANAEEWAGYYEHPIHDKPQREMFEGMARVMAEYLAAMVAMDSEPVAWTEKCEITNMQATGLYLRGFPDNSHGRDIPLYRHAQQPLVPPELTEDMEMEYFLRDDWKGTFRGGWEACRAAMLKGGNSQVIPGWIPVSERMPEERMSVILWDAEIGEVTSGHYSHKTQTFYHRGDAIENEITHWMVVAAPQEVKGE